MDFTTYIRCESFAACRHIFGLSAALPRPYVFNNNIDLGGEDSELCRVSLPVYLFSLSVVVCCARPKTERAFFFAVAHFMEIIEECFPISIVRPISVDRSAFF